MLTEGLMRTMTDSSSILRRVQEGNPSDSEREDNTTNAVSPDRQSAHMLYSTTAPTGSHGSGEVFSRAMGIC